MRRTEKHKAHSSGTQYAAYVCGDCAEIVYIDGMRYHDCDAAALATYAKFPKMRQVLGLCRARGVSVETPPVQAELTTDDAFAIIDALAKALRMAGQDGPFNRQASPEAQG